MRRAGFRWGTSPRYFCTATPSPTTLPLPTHRPTHGWKVLFFGTDDVSLATLRALHTDRDLVASIEVVCPPDSQKGGQVKRYAQQHQLPFHQPTDLSHFQVPAEAEVAVVASYGRLIPEQIIRALPYGGLNMHPSLLPFYRGPAPLLRQLENGDQVGGISIIELHPFRFDLGRIYLQWMFRMSDTIRGAEFAEAASQHGAHAIWKVLRDYNVYRAQIESQGKPSELLTCKESIPELPTCLGDLWSSSHQSLLPSLTPGDTLSRTSQTMGPRRPTYARALKPTDGEIVWDDLTALQVYNKWRAFARKPGCFTFFPWLPQTMNRKRVKLVELDAPLPKEQFDSEQFVSPGHMRYCSQLDAVLLGCRDQPLLARTLQAEGKKPLSAKAFHHGYLSSFPDATAILLPPENKE